MAFRAAGRRLFNTARRFRAPLFRAAFGVSTATALSFPLVFAASAPAPTQPKKNTTVPVGDYGAVRKAIADILEDPSYDDGSLGPLFVRLAWHASGTYCVFSKTGGSNGGTMRFIPESTDGANAGLDIARGKLDSIRTQFPWISYGDLWTLAGAVAIEEMGGPAIAWTPGRVDITDAQKNRVPPNGRLPAADRGSDHIRAIFYRMGFSDREIVALIGAHSLGRCHKDRSGFEGPWTRAPTTFSNEFFRLLLSEKWQLVTLDNGNKQFVNASKRDLMMLPADMALLEDKDFKQYVHLYAQDENAFSADFAQAFSKLLQLGVSTGKCPVAH